MNHLTGPTRGNFEPEKAKWTFCDFCKIAEASSLAEKLDRHKTGGSLGKVSLDSVAHFPLRDAESIEVSFKNSYRRIILCNRERGTVRQHSQFNIILCFKKRFPYILD